MPASTKKQILHEPVLRLKYTAQDDPSTPAPRELDMPLPYLKLGDGKPQENLIGRRTPLKSLWSGRCLSYTEDMMNIGEPPRG